MRIWIIFNGAKKVLRSKLLKKVGQLHNWRGLICDIFKFAFMEATRIKTLKQNNET